MQRYFTTPIYYASGAPHLGHAYTTIVADCYKRYYQLRGDKVLLASGTDEHGQKIERAAQRANVPVKAFVDARSQEFLDLWRALGLDIDCFERTTAAAHQAIAVQFWQRLKASGDIYKGIYEGYYCVDCEQYFTDATAGDNCPVHRTPLESFGEASWFFRLSKYQSRLIEHIETHPEFIVPASRRNEVLAFLRNSTLHDLSVSRASTCWGIPVPDDGDHVLYVWIDALATYLSALQNAPGTGFTGIDDSRFIAIWREAKHFIGKDILTFHAVYWPALLWSAGLPAPRQLIVNGWLTVEGKKIAKSDPSTVIDPAALTSNIGRDGLRLYLLKTVGLGQDLDFNRDQLIQSINADLANNIGNLFSRFIALAQKYSKAGWQKQAATTEADEALFAEVRSAARTIEQQFEAGDPAHGARALVDAAARINAWFQQQAPWKIEDSARLATVLWATHQVLADLTILATPFVPDTAAGARVGLCLDQPAAWDQLGQPAEFVRCHSIPPLYGRIETGSA